MNQKSANATKFPQIGYAAMPPEIALKRYDPATAHAAVQAGALLVDVRDAWERLRCSYEGAEVVHLPYPELKARFAELPLDRPIVFACHSGIRSLRAAAYLAFKGHREVSNLEGGMLAWEAAGLPVDGPGCACTRCSTDW